MSHKWKRPGNALQRTAGANLDGLWENSSIQPTYATFRDLQTRYLQRRHGLDKRTARMLAGICFGEER
ncbi:hypothetical protein [Marimonas lutisalis]|uniref:hypothetical protein n=1 Tax=Marimonas lutisalis TaxID=2545756 RepID=UPI0010F5692E|nr:hypothetical protein [Marimonas lutisalis]